MIQCHFLRHRSHMKSPAIEPEALWWEASTYTPQMWHYLIFQTVLKISDILSGCKSSHATQKLLNKHPNCVCHNLVAHHSQPTACCNTYAMWPCLILFKGIHPVINNPHLSLNFLFNFILSHNSPKRGIATTLEYDFPHLLSQSRSFLLLWNLAFITIFINALHCIASLTTSMQFTSLQSNTSKIHFNIVFISFSAFKTAIFSRG
jgi:hypothetical protein